MEKYIINGGKISGSVKIESAKNALLPMISASILTEEEVLIKSCPKLLDVLSMLRILNKLGVKTQFVGDDLLINSKDLISCHLDDNLTKGLRTSVLMLGALMGRCKTAKLNYPGGCEIGKRPIDIHLNSLKELGVNVNDDGREIFCYTDRLVGKEIFLSFPSVGATENLLLASVKAEGITKIHNYAKEPEILDLIKMLNSMGARISFNSYCVTIEGVKKLHGTKYLPLSDRIETGTFLLASALTGGEIELINAKPQNILPLIGKFCESTCKIILKNDIIYLKFIKGLKAFNVTTGPFPLFPTDLQAPISVLASVSKGESTICERIFENRFGYAEELNKMGARILVNGDTATIKGVKRLHGEVVRARDLRGGAALVLAGLNAEGKTEVYDVSHVERGYYEFDKKLSMLGIDIKKVKER